MVIAHHLIWTAYGWWLPNDPRGSSSHEIRVERIAEMGELHHGRKKAQPSSAELRRFFGDAAPPDNVFHVVTDELGWPCVCRVYQVSRNVEAVVRAIRQDVTTTRRVPEIEPWISAGDYGVALLVPWADKVSRVRETLTRSGLTDEVPIVVGIGPTADTVQKALKHEG